MSKDFKEIQRKVESLGYRVIPGPKHRKVLTPTGAFLTTIPRGDGDIRAWRNWVTQFRHKTGIDLRKVH